MMKLSFVKISVLLILLHLLPVTSHAAEKWYDPEEG
jgi:hypothetical protein